MKLLTMSELFIWVQTAECKEISTLGQKTMLNWGAEQCLAKSAGNQDSNGSWTSDPDMKGPFIHYPNEQGEVVSLHSVCWQIIYYFLAS